MQRVWILSELYFPEQTSTGYFLTGIAEALAQEFDTRVLCSQPTYSARGQFAPAVEQRNGVHVRRCRSTRLDKDRLLGRATNAFTFGSTLLQHALREVRSNDIILAVTTPPTLPLIAAAVARARHARLLVLVHDVYPDVLVATGMARPDATIVRGGRVLTSRVYRAAERVIVLGRDMHKRVTAGLPSDRHTDVRIIPNWGDVRNVRPDADAGAEVKRRLGLEGKHVVQFMGNLGRTHGVDSVIDAARLLSSNPSIHVQFVGWGSRAAALRERIEADAMVNVSVEPPCPAEELNGYLNAADVSLIAFVPGMSGISVPSRLYNVLAAGRPVIAVCDDDAELAQVVGEEACGWVVPPDRADLLAATILESAMCNGARSAMAERARAAAVTRYHYGAIAQQYRDLIRELAAETPTARAS